MKSVEVEPTDELRPVTNTDLFGSSSSSSSSRLTPSPKDVDYDEEDYDEDNLIDRKFRVSLVAPSVVEIQDVVPAPPVVEIQNAVPAPPVGEIQNAVPAPPVGEIQNAVGEIQNAVGEIQNAVPMIQNAVPVIQNVALAPADNDGWVVVRSRKFGMVRGLFPDPELPEQSAIVCEDELVWSPKAGPRRAKKKWAKSRKGAFAGTKDGVASFVYPEY